MTNIPIAVVICPSIIAAITNNTQENIIRTIDCLRWILFTSQELLAFNLKDESFIEGIVLKNLKINKNNNTPAADSIIVAEISKIPWGTIKAINSTDL